MEARAPGASHIPLPPDSAQRASCQSPRVLTQACKETNGTITTVEVGSQHRKERKTPNVTHPQEAPALPSQSA